MYRAYEVAKDVYWVGALEWNERIIHGTTMPKGSTNNAYLICDERPTLIDTCISLHSEELLDRISSVMDPSSLEYIISSHSEKDHADSIGRVLAAAPQATVVTSVKGLPILETYFGPDHRFMAVRTGDELEIGARTLTFIQTPMVHWPDNMVTYSPADKILFSNDGFGQFIATSKRFDDEVDLPSVLACAKKYFANILTPYQKQTAKALQTVKELDIDLIAPAHGVIWRSHRELILELYDQWSSPDFMEEKAVVAYSTMYGSTERMAKALVEAFMAKGITVRLYDLDISDFSEIIADILDATYVCVGSPTHNNTVLPAVGGFLTYLSGLAPKGRYGLAFGSYGWAEGAQKEIAHTLEKAGFTMLGEPFAEQWNDREEDQEALFEAMEKVIP